MFNTFKVCPQDTVRRQGSFAQFTVDERQYSYQQPYKSPTLPKQQPHLQFQHSNSITRPRAMSEPLPVMEPCLTKMELPAQPQFHHPGLESPSHLPPMHGTLLPLQTHFPVQFQVNAGPSPMTTPPRSPYGYHQISYSHTVSPISLNP